MTFFGLLLVQLIGVTARADSVLVGTASTATTGGVAVSNTQYLAQSFSLTTPVFATTLDVEIQSNTVISEPFSLFLTTGLGPGETTLNQRILASLANRSTHPMCFR